MPSYRKLPSGLWQATVYKPNGARVTDTDRLKSVVKDWAQDLEARYKRGDRRDPRAGQVTLGEWRARVIGSRSLEGPTLRKLDSLWRTHCKDEWADWPMNAVTRAEAQEWANGLRTTRRARHRGRATKGEDEVPTLGAVTVREAVNVMTMLYSIAAAEDPPLVISNPFSKLALPKIEPRPVEFYEHAEASLLYRAIKARSGMRWRLLVEMGMHSGLRPGELYGLHTDRLDWSRGLVEVTRVMTRVGLRGYPKSRKSHRQVPVPPHILDALAELLGAGRNWAGGCTCPAALPGGKTKPGGGPCHGLVFPASQGGPADDGNVRDRIWYPAVEATGIRRFPPKIMRHTAASWLVQDGVPLYDVQHLLGHESFTTTQKYAHLAPDAHDKIRESWGRRPGT